MLSFGISSRRAKVDAERRPSKSHAEGVVLRAEDAYFGALTPSSDTLLEEFGFVPTVVSSSRREDRTSLLDPWEHEGDGNFVFHDNEYEEFHRIYQHADPEGEQLAFEYMPVNDLALCNVTNFVLREKARLMMVDEKVAREVENAITATATVAANTNAKATTADPTSTHKYSKISYQKASESYDYYGGLEQEARRLCTPTTAASEAVLGKDVEIRRKRFAGDLYTPRWVRGKGLNREGFCEICSPGLWLKIKQSAYWYHMNFIHGISASTGQLYDAPVEYRERPCRRMNGDELVQLEGRCKDCGQWVIILHCPLGRDTGREVEQEAGNASWWRHAQKCSSSLRSNGSGRAKMLKKRARPAAD